MFIFKDQFYLLKLQLTFELFVCGFSINSYTYYNLFKDNGLQWNFWKNMVPCHFTLQNSHCSGAPK